MRGMGLSAAPEDPQAYNVETICADLIGLLDHLGLPQAVFSGLDFGAFAAHDLALRYPEKVKALIMLENPAPPHNPDISPLTEYKEMGKDHFLHINYFCDTPGVADADMLARVDAFFPKVILGAQCGRAIILIHLITPLRFIILMRLTQRPARLGLALITEEMQAFYRHLQTVRLYRRAELVSLNGYKMAGAAGHLSSNQRCPRIFSRQ